MFGKKRTVADCDYTVSFDCGVVHTDFNSLDILRHVRRQIVELKAKNEALKEELAAIKSVVENKDIKPPVSRDCGDCKFAVYSPWDNISVIGCRKDCLCEDFTPKEGNR